MPQTASAPHGTSPAGRTPTARSPGSIGVALVALLAASCVEEPPRPSVDPLCVDLRTDVIDPQTTYVRPAVFPCSSDLDCPPPLSCPPVLDTDPLNGNGTIAAGTRVCRVRSDVLFPADLFGVPTLDLQYEADPRTGDMRVGGPLPDSVRYMHCELLGCPSTPGMVRGTDRCVLSRVTIARVGPSFSLNLEALLDEREYLPGTDPRRPRICEGEVASSTTEMLFDPTRANVVCWGYSDTRLVGVSPTLPLPRGADGELIQSIASDCLPGERVCLYADDEFGVCDRSQGRAQCCTPCAVDADCPNNVRCTLPRGPRTLFTPADDTNPDTWGPFTGVCRNSCVDATARTDADGGVAGEDGGVTTRDAGTDGGAP